LHFPAAPWIEPYNVIENGRGAFLAWADHYNGQGELLKCTAMAKAKIKSLFYKNECSLSFEKVMEILSKSFSTLNNDPDERYSECQKVDKLLQWLYSDARHGSGGTELHCTICK
jgi:hypothetical protein